MSTRCNIGFYSRPNQNVDEPDQMLYRHSDGYPDGEHGVVACILPFLRLFQERRGLSDTEYAAAWTLWHLITKSVEHRKEFRARMGQDSMFTRGTADDGIDCLGYGICSGHGRHGDIEYYYAVYPDRLDVYDGEGIIATHNLSITE